MGARSRWLLNFTVFQLGWFACVLGGAHGIPVAGSLFAVAGVMVHLMLCAAPRRELAVVAAVAALGGAWDCLVVNLAALDYASGQLGEGLTAHWIVALWALFATTLNSSMGWMQGRRLTQALMGGIGGPLSFLAGHELGAVDMPDVPLALTVQGLGWALLVPLACWIAARLGSPPGGATLQRLAAGEAGA